MANGLNSLRSCGSTVIPGDAEAFDRRFEIVSPVGDAAMRATWRLDGWNWIARHWS
jgi:hypothetical protein